MDTPTRDYRASASPIDAAVRARKALRSAFGDLTRALGNPDGEDDPASSPREIARLLESARDSAQRAADTLAALAELSPLAVDGAKGAA
jgi:hypothetical protein